VTVSVSVTELTLNKTATSLFVGGKEVLEARVSPSDATNKSVNWNSSNPSVASVSDGEITAIASGTATVTATAIDGGSTAACSVTVSLRTETEPELIAAKDVFKDGNEPEGAKFGKNGALIWENLGSAENNNNDNIILKNEDLAEGWIIDDFDPKSGSGWKAEFLPKESKDAIVVKFTGEAYVEGSIKVIIAPEDMALSEGEKKALAVEFTSGQKTDDNGGCNVLYGYLAFTLLAVPFVLKGKSKGKK